MIFDHFDFNLLNHIRELPLQHLMHLIQLILNGLIGHLRILHTQLHTLTLLLQPLN